jgi:hypothetical protein
MPGPDLTSTATNIAENAARSVLGKANSHEIPAPSSAHDSGQDVHDSAGKHITVRGGGSDYGVARDARKE